MKQRDPIIQRIRRNHALEHATMHILARGGERIRLVGRSDWGGFTIYGNVDTQRLIDAAQDGLARLKQHQDWLAVHPRCGTNLATGVLAASLIGQVATSGLRSPLLRYLGAGLAVLAGFVLARPLGMAAQGLITTSANLRGAYIASVKRQTRGGVMRHRVLVGHRA